MTLLSDRIDVYVKAPAADGRLVIDIDVVTAWRGRAAELECAQSAPATLAALDDVILMVVAASDHAATTLAVLEDALIFAERRTIHDVAVKRHLLDTRKRLTELRESITP